MRNLADKNIMNTPIQTWQAPKNRFIGTSICVSS